MRFVILVLMSAGLTGYFLTGCAARKVVVQEKTNQIDWYYQPSVNFDFKSMKPFSCEELLVPVPNSLVGDSVVGSYPKFLPESWRFMAFINSPGVLKYTLCNVGPHEIDLPRLTFRFVVFRPTDNNISSVASVLK